MVSLTFHGGVDEIGGNKILLKDRDAKVWLDNGARFGSGGEGFQRMNLACPLSILQEGLTRIVTALKLGQHR